MAMGCENEVIGEGYPEMEGFYVESCGLPAVTSDSVKAFTVKVDNYTTLFPDSKGHPLYPKIVANIKTAFLQTTLTADPAWASTTIVDF